jgi:glyoxylase-like metal-dependent hydrolase (beta-lactamase superfamily II)/rhodanese-related sulfurtransferase
MFCRELNRTKCKTYLIACERTRRAMLIDPLKENTGRYIAVAAYHSLRLDYLVDTHSHADHRSGTFDLADLTDAKVVMERHAPAPHVAIHVADGDVLELGDLRIRIMHTPGHTPDSMSLSVDGRVFTGDTLLIGGTGRADFPGGDAGHQYDGIVNSLFILPNDTLVFPAHDYRGNHYSTIGQEKSANPRIAGKTREQYVHIMNNLGLALPDKVQESLQANQSAIEDESIKFPDLTQLNAIHQIAPVDLAARLKSESVPVVIDVREPEEYHDELGHLRGSRLIPLRTLSSRAAELEAFKNADVIVVCRAGVRSTTGAAILTALGFEHVSNLKGGMLEWNEAALPVER